MIRTIDDTIALRAELQPGARLAVIGAGFIGAEVASTARKLGLDVTVVEAALIPPHAQLGSQLGAVVAPARILLQREPDAEVTAAVVASAAVEVLVVAVVDGLTLDCERF